MKKRILSLLLALVMLVGLLPTVALAADGTPTTETAEDGKTYYLIDDEADLKWFRDQVNGGHSTINAKLTANITLTEAWTPIGKPADYSAGVYEPNAFKGIFDGNQKTISGLNVTYNGSVSASLGLFGETSGATIENLTVRGNVSATITGSDWGSYYVGGVVGNGFNTTLYRVISYVNVSNNSANTSYGSQVGGLVGNGNKVTIQECANYGAVESVDAGNGGNVGGLTGISVSVSTGSACTIMNSFNTGTVSGTATAGGLLPVISGSDSFETKITNCYTTGAAVGKVTGNTKVTITNCYATAKTVDVDGITVVDEAGLKSDATLATLNAGESGNAFVKGDDGLPVLRWMKSGSSDTPAAKPTWNDGYYEIQTAQQLGWLRDQVNSGDLNGHTDFSAKLMNDIELTGEWTPIGKGAYGGNPYYGEFNGQGHKITGLSITQEASASVTAGLFGSAGESAGETEIHDLTVEGQVSVTILNGASGYDFMVAGIVAYSNGKVKLERVISKVDVTCDDQRTLNLGSDSASVAGLNANAQGSDTIIECANYGMITSKNQVAGNVAGLAVYGYTYMDCGVTVESSFNAGAVTGANNVGGLVSLSGGKITNCYNTGKVTATKAGGKAGGLSASNSGTVTNCYTVGEAFGSKTSTAVNCYATENASASTNVTVKTFEGLKALTGDLNKAKITVNGKEIDAFVANDIYPPRLYWEDEANYPAACDHPAARCEVSYAKKDSKQHTVTTFCRKCLSTITADANHEASENGMRCKLCGYTFCEHGGDKQKTTAYSPIEAQPGMHTKTVTCACGEIVETTTEACTKDETTGKCEHCGADLTNVPAIEDGFYQIATEAELKWFRNEVNKGNHAIKAKMMNDITLQDVWTPIGTSENNFAGIFDGNGKTISGLHFDVQNMSENDRYLGLFGAVGGSEDSAAEIRDLTVRGEIRVDDKVTSGFTVGGVAAWVGNYTTISGVTSDVTIVNTPADSVSSVTTGGVIGETKNNSDSIQIKNCANLGPVTGRGTTGGLIGNARTGANDTHQLLISGCYNAGAVSGSGTTGGLIGEAGQYVKIDDCYNVGNVTGGVKYTGGLVGELSARLRTSYSAGTVTSADGKTGSAVGRLVGNGGVGAIGDTFVIKEPGIGDNGTGGEQDTTLVTEEELRKIPADLNENSSFKVNPGKTPALTWETVADCQHPENKKGFAYVAILNDGRTASGKHTKQLICEDCFYVFEQAVEACTEGRDYSCIYCGAVLCDHSATPEAIKKYTYIYGSAEQGRWAHRVQFTCVTCGRTIDETDDCELKIEYKPVSGKEGERHQVLKECLHCGAKGGYTEACVDNTDGKGFDKQCDICGATLTKILPSVQPGNGFVPYISVEGKQNVTRYTVTHYEVGAAAEELMVVAASGDGTVPAYQWYYRTQEDAVDKDGNPVAGTLISGATGSSFMPDTSAETEMRFYYCVVTNGFGGTATSPAQPVIVCENPTVTAYFSLTNDDEYVIGDGKRGGSGRVMAFQQVTVPYFDLGLYGLQSGYFRSETYGPQDPNEPMGGSALSAGTSATAYGKITDLHLMIYMLERDYLNLPEAQCGKGYLYENQLMGLGSAILETDGGAGSILVRHYWGHDMNFNYYQNYVYPLASAGWGATADQIILRDGEIFTLAMFTDWGFYTKSGAGFQHLGTDEDKCAVSIEPGVSETFDLTLYRSYGYDQNKYDTTHTPVPNANVYYIHADSLTVGTVGTNDWTPCGTTDAKGKIKVDPSALGLTAGETYLFATPGQKQGNGDDAVVACPGGILVKVAASARKTVTFVDRLGETTTQKVAAGSAVKKPADPAHAGYTFLGWFTDAACKNAYAFSTPVEDDLTLYAGWQENAAPVTPVTPVTPSTPAQLPQNPNAGETLPFTDVNANSWYYSGVKFVYEKGLMNGTGNGTFSPNADTTRGMIVTMLARLEGQNTSGTPWYAAGQKWAMDNGISDGTNMTGAITREQLAAILFRYAKQKGYDVSKSVELNGFVDANTVSGYATEAMQWAVANGLIQGSNSKLSPKATASRAQVATILMRFMELYAK